MAKKLFSQPIILSLLIIGLLVGVNRYGWLNRTQEYLFNFLNPLQESLYGTSLKTRNFASFLSSLKNMKSENEELKKKNQELLGEIARLNEIKQENELLREQLCLSDGQEKELILADVVGQDLSGLGRFLLINKGEEDGLKEGMTVIAAGNILVGRVVEVNSFSKVQLITDINSRVNAALQESGASGLVKGDSFGLTIDLIAQGEEIGGLVVTSGLAGIFPSGLLIGSVEEIISNDAQVFQKAKINSAVNFNILEKVFVIK